MGEMHEQSDARLLREYAEHGNEAAFREIVFRHTDLIYSAAVRQSTSADLARDVVQGVFADLARKAQPLSKLLHENASVLGWLFRSTRFAALNQLRDERRRQARERQAMENVNSASEAAPLWDCMRPVLDEAMSDLSDEDRDALLLRFFKNEDFKTLGRRLGVSDDTAQKRVSRALERLRGEFARRGVTTTAGALSTAISANAVTLAPAGLAAAVSTASLIGPHMVTSATTTIARTIVMTTPQKVLIGAALVAALGAGVYQARQASTLRSRYESLQHTLAPLTDTIQQLQHERDDLTNRLAALRSGYARSNANDSELLRLRGEVGALRNKVKDLDRVASDPSVRDTLAWKAKEDRLRQLLTERPDQNIPELGLLDDRTFQDVARDANLDTEDGIRTALSRLRFIAENKIANEFQPALQQFTQANNGNAPQSIAQLAPYIDPPIDNAIFDRYEVVNTGTNVVAGWRGGWVISQKKAVDADHDARWLISPVGFQNADFKTWGQ
jgi:RNA polymerase sigma factor (sigma-70 family)